MPKTRGKAGKKAEAVHGGQTFGDPGVPSGGSTARCVYRGELRHSRKQHPCDNQMGGKHAPQRRDLQPARKKVLAKDAGGYEVVLVDATETPIERLKKTAEVLLRKKRGAR